MSNKAKKITAIAVIIVFLAAFILPVLFSPFVRASGLSNAQKNMQETQQKLNEKKVNQKKIVAEKEKADKVIMQIESSIDTVNTEIQQHTDNITRLELEIEDTTIELDEQYAMLKKRIRVMYENGSDSYMEALLTAESITDFFSRYEIIKTIAEYDRDMLDSIQAELEKIKDAKSAIEQEKQAVEQKRAALKVEQDKLAQEQQARNAMISEANVEIKELEKRYKEYEEMDRRERAAASSKMGTNTKYSGGSMEWPTPSCYTITSPFGYRIHPIFKTQKYHAGIDIGAQYGASIVAANAGKVITSKFSSSYGNYIVVDHGGGIATLYAHGSKRLVSEGASVTRGQKIMEVGSTGNSTGPHLHYEVIVNGATVDPMSYY